MYKFSTLFTGKHLVKSMFIHAKITSMLSFISIAENFRFMYLVIQFSELTAAPKIYTSEKNMEHHKNADKIL